VIVFPLLLAGCEGEPDSTGPGVDVECLRKQAQQTKQGDAVGAVRCGDDNRVFPGIPS
jgi:hypothetical protein